MTTPNAGKNVKKLDLSYTAVGNIKLYSHYEKYYGSFFKTQKQTNKNPLAYHIIQQ